MKEIDITGHKFGMLTAIERVSKYKPQGNYWLCKCDCGNMSVVRKYDLVHLKNKSCGCYIKKRAKELHTTHNKTNTILYPIWSSMKQRCFNSNSKAYCNYGGRGITICDEWLGENGFSNFENWAYQNGYEKGLSIDRIDNNGNYEPNNCRWSTREEQQNNRRGVHKFSYNGETHSPAEWSRITGISDTTIKNRVLKQGMSVEQALTKPNYKMKRFEKGDKIANSTEKQAET